MIELFLLAITILVFVAYYKWQQNLKISKKIEWIPGVPGWPIIGNIFDFGTSTEVLSDIQKIIRNNGKLVKIDILTEYSLIVADYDFLEFMLGTNQLLNKSNDYHFLRQWLGTGLLTSDGPKWKKRRRLVTPAFHFSILERFIESFEKNGKILVEKLKREQNKSSLDIYSFINLYTLDIICEAAMGVKVHAQKNEKSDYVNDVKEESRISSSRCFSVLKANDILYKFSTDYYKEVKAVHNLHAVTYSVIDARKKELEETKTTAVSDDLGRKKKLAFLDLLLNSTVDGKPLSREDVREEVDTFMFEGHDTTSSAITFTIYLLAHHPAVQVNTYNNYTPDLFAETSSGGTERNIQRRYAKRSNIFRPEPNEVFGVGNQRKFEVIPPGSYVFERNKSRCTRSQEELALEEQKEIFNDDMQREATFSDLNQMKYLELVIKESLRLYPPVPMFSRETSQDMEYKGNIIPKGLCVSVFCYGILRDPDYYSDPDKFDPSRFENIDGTKPYSYIPFSAGPRNCIGQKFAMLEMKSCLSKVLRNFELMPAEPEHKPILAAELTLKPTNGVMIKIAERKS